MATKFDLGIIGIGVLGTAILAAASAVKTLKVATFDKFKPEFPDFEGVLTTEVCFVCVPTPTVGGVQITSALEEVCALLAGTGYAGVVVNKCTVLPGTTARLKVKYPSLRLVHSPEFLTEARANHDFYFQDFALLSGTSDDCEIVKNAMVSICHQNIRFQFHSRYEVTEFSKYMHNLFLAAKIELLNEFADACESLDVTYSNVVSGAASQGKMSYTHLAVPGPDGKRGYAGSCFPKDMSAFVTWAKANLISVPVLEAAHMQNLLRRPETKADV